MLLVEAPIAVAAVFVLYVATCMLLFGDDE